VSPPRLCFVVESGTDVRLIDGLAERFELTVLARRVAGGGEISRTPERQVSVTIGPMSRLGFAWMVRETLRRAAPLDVVLVQGYGLAALAANLASRQSGVRTCMLVCSPLELYYQQRRNHPEPGKPFRRVELWGINMVARANARLAQHYVVLSRHLASIVREHGTRAPIDIIPVYGVDTTVFRPSIEPNAVLRQRRALPATGAVIFFSSRVAPEKDSDTVLLAVRRLLADGRDLWLLHRSGGYRAFFESAQRVGVAERVIATDAAHPVKELPLDYQASDLLVQASREEGLGFSPLEALACGVPVVASAVGGLRETIVDGETGWTCPPGDADALARCIGAALASPGEALRRANAGREMVCARYERQLVFDRLTGVLGDLGMSP
jgi:glycosyltransferase involved in cell wall biosynthesis